ncbi:hypothetical protein [Falsiroseomonas selenitidurans]|uniref:Uncharacterized protein n=1 Tax=Falsiroseomonas selenitidurans TaxID=2716335 RepID=A0ABX1E738_9PROT|nr:hypothetical protein [Falsiroseomonas selenitidurans]NKC33009.1 hypothetical protein [Falsiroseomonas selenitidurans]
MLSWLSRHFHRPRSADPTTFGDFLAGEAAFLGQKPALDYCKVKAGRGERALLEDPDFRAALAHCRWQSFAGSTLDVLALAEGWLRPHAAGAEPQLALRLAGLAAGFLDAAPVPEAERETLAAVKAELPDWLTRQQAAPPVPADRRAMRVEAPLLATLPIHPDQRRGETPAIRGALRFHLVAAQQRMEKLFDPAPLAARLLA